MNLFPVRVYWSSVGGKSYPVPLRALSFEHIYCALDPAYDQAAADTFAQTLKDKFQSVLAERLEHVLLVPAANESDTLSENGADVEPVDTLAVYKNNAIEAFRNNRELMDQIRSRGKPWGTICGFLESELADTLEDRSDIAYNLVREALERIFGLENDAWYTFKRPNRSGKQITWVKAGKGS